MTALIDVDRIIDRFVRDRIDSTTGRTRCSAPTDRRPGPDPCPSWCRLAPGHPYLTESPTGLQSRYHESEVIADGRLGGGQRVEARLVAQEHRTPAGQSALAEARIVIDGIVIDGPEGLDAGQARMLAGVLSRAADRLQKPLPRVA